MGNEGTSEMKWTLRLEELGAAGRRGLPAGRLPGRLVLVPTVLATGPDVGMLVTLVPGPVPSPYNLLHHKGLAIAPPPACCWS